MAPALRSRAWPRKWANVYGKVTMWFAWKMCFFSSLSCNSRLDSKPRLLMSATFLCSSWSFSSSFMWNIEASAEKKNVVVFLHTSLALGLGPGPLSWYRVLWLMGKLVSWIWNVWNVLRFFFSAHLCHDINQMPEQEFARLPPYLWK